MTCDAPALNRVLLEVGPLTIYWYGFIIATGLFLGLYLATYESKRIGFKKDLIVDLVMFAAPIAIIFARLYYVIFEWEQYKHGPLWKVFAIWEGGIAIHGALIGAVLTAIVFARVKKVSFWQMADIIAPSLILGQAIGRWGNFMNQEAHGGPISESTFQSFHQYLPDFIMNQMCINGTYYHPTFLYESGWNMIVFVLLLVVIRKFNPFRGEVFLSYLIMYSVGRFFIEGMRTDSLFFGVLKQAQFISVLIIIGAVALIIYRRKSRIVKHHYDGKKITKK